MELYKGKNKNHEWIQLRKKFSLPQNVYYIRLTLTGKGKGKNWFDDIKLLR